ncbi:N-acetylglucosaminyltransferase [Loxospora ochrophaea]|nr:N-acetylglucosaminyltransferase [Loxospora ochrophaea]
MVFEALDRLGSKADRILLYPEEWDLEITSLSDRDSQLLVKAREWYNVKLVPIQVQKFETNKDGQKTWDESATKFLTFSQTQYLRILHFDSDVTVFKHMDELFLLPPAAVAMVRAYWSLPSIRSLTSLFILLEPSESKSARLMDAARAKTRRENEYDMEILNNMYGDSAMILPHKQFGLLSGEFRGNNHTNFLGNDYEVWDPDRAMREASLIHFSDWPIPKPWIMWPRNLLQESLPKCTFNPGTEKEEGCRNREDICGLLSIPAPEWPPRKKTNGTKSEGSKPVL